MVSLLRKSAVAALLFVVATVATSHAEARFYPRRGYYPVYGPRSFGYGYGAALYYQTHPYVVGPSAPYYNQNPLPFGSSGFSFQSPTFSRGAPWYQY